VRREQFEIRAAEPLEKIVLGPTGHMSCSGRESAPARTLRFHDGVDGSKVHTRRFSRVEKWPPVCGIPEIAGAHGTRGKWCGRTRRPSTSQTLCRSAHSRGADRRSVPWRSTAPRALCPTDRRPIPQRRRAGGPEGGEDVRHPKRASQSCAGRLFSAWAR
jgi:hypothetical protein